jgi:lysyl-tRNA synthetase class 2
MDDTNSLIEQRKAKLAALRAKGIDPFKNKFTPTETCRHAREQYAEGREVALAGRITAHRDMGKSMFLDIRDQSGRMQIYAQKNVLGDEQFAIFQHLDLADFIGVKGTQFTTKTNEISVKITGFTILAKALRPPPAKWHGLEDTEIRYRQRYLDLMASKAAAPGTSTTGFEKGSPGDVLLLRSEIIREIRNFLHTRGYVEVETPMMQAIPGGAAAQPFVTKHNALGCNFYLRIALELYLKRLLVGGVDKVFELGRNFRNEGLSRKHNPEFTMLEAYEAYGDYESMMELVESLVVHVAETAFPNNKLKFPRVRHGEATREILNALVYCLTNLGQFIETASKSSPAEVGTAKALQSEIFKTRDKYNSTQKEKPHWEIAREALGETRPLFERTKAILKNWEHPDNPTGISSWAPGVESHLASLEELTVEEIIDLKRPWKRAKYKDLVREKVREKTSGLVPDWFVLSPQDRRKAAIELLKLGGDIGTNYEDFEVTGAVFEKLIEPTLIQPTFVTHLPKELVPLAKLSPDDPTTVEVFECCINGQEIAPAYTEQNDPIAQRERLEHQAASSRSWTRIFSSRWSMACPRRAAWAWALTACA